MVLGTATKQYFRLAFTVSETRPNLLKEGPSHLHPLLLITRLRGLQCLACVGLSRTAPTGLELGGMGILTHFPLRTSVRSSLGVRTNSYLIVIGRKPLPTCGDGGSHTTLLLLSVRFSFLIGPPLLKERLPPYQDALLPPTLERVGLAYRWVA